MAETMIADGAPNSKKAKLEEEASSATVAPSILSQIPSEQLNDLKSFEVVSMVGSKRDEKAVCVQIAYKPDASSSSSSSSSSDAKGLLILRKTPFPNSMDDVRALVGDSSVRKDKTTFNDRFLYSNASSTSDNMAIEIIWPATSKDMAKYTAIFSPPNSHVVRESAQMYEAVTKPYITALPPPTWVYNVLEGTEEADRSVHVDDKCLIALHPHWKSKDSKELKLLAFPMDRALASIRDLRTEHIPLLKHMREKILVKCTELYDVPATKVRLFFHYLPSFFHLHIHVVHMDLVQQDIGCQIGRGVLLDDVIDNLTISGDYYVKASMTLLLMDTVPLWPLMRAYMDKEKEESAAVVAASVSQP